MTGQRYCGAFAAVTVIALGAIAGPAAAIAITLARGRRSR